MVFFKQETRSNNVTYYFGFWTLYITFCYSPEFI